MLRQTRRRSAGGLLAVLAAATLALGCGDDEGDEYREDLRNATSDYLVQVEKGNELMVAAAQSRSRAQYSEGVETIRSALSDYNGTLAQLDEPDGAEDEERALIEALRAFSDAMGRLDAAVQSGDRDQVARQQAATQPLIKRVQDAGSALDDAL